MNMPISPAQRLGLKQNDYHSSVERFEHWQRLLKAEDPVSHPDNTGRLSWFAITGFAMSDAELVAEISYLRGETQACHTWCRKTGEAIDYYLFGDWKEKERHDDGTIDARRWFEHEPPVTWTQCFDMDLGWVAVGRHWDLVDRILRFPRPAIVTDSGGRSARAYYLGLAQWWADRTNTGWIDEAKTIRGAASKGYHLLCDAVAGISESDAKATATGLRKYVEWFLKRRDHEEQFPMAATFLWNVAHRDKLSLDLPEEIDNYLFRLPDEF